MELVIPSKFEWLAPFKEGLACFAEKGRYGFCDVNGAVTIEPKYRSQSAFFEGLAPVLEQRLYGFIDKAAEPVIPAVFEYAATFSEGLACVKRGEKYGFIDKRGEWVRQPDLDNADYFSDGLAAVRLGDAGFYIDSSGNKVGPEFEKCGEFRFGRAICMTNGHYVSIDRDFRITGRFEQFDWVASSLWEDGIVQVCKSGNSGYADVNGRPIVETIYEDASPFFTEGRAAVMKNGKWAMISSDGKSVDQITDFLFDDVSGFKEGLALVQMGKYFRFVDRDGALVGPKFSSAQLFSEGLAAVWSD